MGWLGILQSESHQVLGIATVTRCEIHDTNVRDEKFEYDEEITSENG